LATALITGASAGIGEAFARLLAAEKFDLVLVARDVARLEAKATELRNQFGIAVEVLPADLSKSDQLLKVEARLHDQSRPIEVLINNAGFRLIDNFFHSDIAAENELLEVLVRAPMRLMHSILPAMRERNSGIVINVSSVAGWTTGGTYNASKSYLTVLSESMHTKLLGTKVNVMALCPGFTRTEFHQRGKMTMTGLPNFLWLSADEVVSKAWKGAQAGDPLCVPGWQYAILSTFARFGPRPIIRRLGISLRSRRGIKR
jgi:short-subunit dehydrogenase